MKAFKVSTYMKNTVIESNEIATEQAFNLVTALDCKIACQKSKIFQVR